jgi:hypothetical protein
MSHGLTSMHADLNGHMENMRTNIVCTSRRRACIISYVINFRGEEFQFTDDWGELCTGKSVSRLFVLHVASGAVSLCGRRPPPKQLSRPYCSPPPCTCTFTCTVLRFALCWIIQFVRGLAALPKEATDMPYGSTFRCRSAAASVCPRRGLGSWPGRVGAGGNRHSVHSLRARAAQTGRQVLQHQEIQTVLWCVVAALCACVLPLIIYSIRHRKKN